MDLLLILLILHFDDGGGGGGGGGDFGTLSTMACAELTQRHSFCHSRSYFLMKIQI